MSVDEYIESMFKLAVVIAVTAFVVFLVVGAFLGAWELWRFIQG